jgi:hypothetical protein
MSKQIGRRDMRKIANILVVLVFTVIYCFDGEAQSEMRPDPTDFPGVVDAAALYERIKLLAGTWEDKSTKGWEGKKTVRLIARGSAVLLTGQFNDEPGEGMASLIFLDRDRLAVTHYCEAGNQPTLVARGVSRDGNSILFTLDRATGLDKPDEGLMDNLILTFKERDRYSSRWTFSRAGKVHWFEEIEHRRSNQAHE